MDTPRYHRVPGSTLIRVEATAPIASLGVAHGRRIDYPVRKVVSFALTDGPAATARKARSKRAERSYSGDYHLIAVLGHTESDEGPGTKEARVLALVPRAPRCASWILACSALVRRVPEDFGEGELASFAALLLPGAGKLAGQLTQGYIYSSMSPPAELMESFERALVTAPDPMPVSGPGSGETLRPPDTTRGGGEEIEIQARTGRNPGDARSSDAAPLAILGAGDYVRIEVAPALSHAALRRAVLCDREPQIAALAAAELGFGRATTDASAAIDSLERRGLIIVATAHDSHAELASRGLEAGHRVLCEKPAIVDATDLDRLLAAVAAAPGELEVGFNRRYHPLVERARRRIAEERGPATIVASIREVDITPDHWYLWPNQGTRVAGNLCHWVDLAIHLLGPGREAVAVSVSPRVSSAPTGVDAERTFSIAFNDGSSVALVPTGRGDSVRGVQEQIEIRRGPLTLRLDDLWKLSGLRAGWPIRQRTIWRDKGHFRMYAAALRRFQSGTAAAYPAEDLRRVGEIQLAATELLLAELPGGEIGDLLVRSRERGA